MNLHNISTFLVYWRRRGTAEANESIRKEMGIPSYYEDLGNHNPRRVNSCSCMCRSTYWTHFFLWDGFAERKTICPSCQEGIHPVRPA